MIQGQDVPAGGHMKRVNNASEADFDQREKTGIVAKLGFKRGLRS